MNRALIASAALALVVIVGIWILRPERTLADPPVTEKGPKTGEQTEPAKAAPALQFKMKDIDGKEVNLADYRGKVVLLVNTASKCGYTKQYAPLQALYEKYKDKGLVVIAVPADNFGHQEPGDNAEIKAFCTTKFSVTFPILGKVSVKGADICPLYKYLTSKDAGHAFGGDIPWNFTKFLVNRKGEIAGRYKPQVDPMKDKQFIKDVEKALGESTPSAEKTDDPQAKTAS